MKYFSYIVFYCLCLISKCGKTREECQGVGWSGCENTLRVQYVLYCQLIVHTCLIAWDILANKKVAPGWKMCDYLGKVIKVGIDQISVITLYVMCIVTPCLEKNNAMVTFLMVSIMTTGLLALWSTKVHLGSVSDSCLGSCLRSFLSCYWPTNASLRVKNTVL